MGQSVSRNLPWNARHRRDRSSPPTATSEVQQRSDAPALTLAARVQEELSASRSNLLDGTREAGLAGSGNLPSRRRSRLQRARTSFTSTIPQIFTRNSSSRSDDLTFVLPPPPQLRPSSRTVTSDASPYRPRLSVPDIEISFDDLTSDSQSQTRPLIRRNSHRSSSMTFDRLTSLRPDRSIRSMTNSFRRRRSPALRTEDQAVVLSRLLSVAAAATAQSLMGTSHTTGGRPRAGQDADGEDGTFDGFLRALQNGRIASELRQGDNGLRNSGEPGQGRGGVGGLNFFRMFRFASSNTTDSQDGYGASSSLRSETFNSTAGSQDNVGEDADGRMVPIIIVGIRSINPGGAGAQDDGNIPPFLESLSTVPTTLTGPASQTIDGVLRQPQNGTRFSHRRRASMGGLHTFPSPYDSQRHYRSPDFGRTRLEATLASALSETPPGPNPPPSTPADGGLSAFSSGHSTPTGRSSLAPMSSHGESFMRRGRRSSLESTAEQPLLRPLRTARHRRLSESDFTRYGSGASRRNGIVGADSSDTSNDEGSRSWIIYVLGGSYPENHPILTTPSLFTDSPTYEDMMLLSTLLGAAKPPVASDEEIATAGGLFRIIATEEGLLARAVEGPDFLPLITGQRCIVCLCDFEKDEEARKLVSCGHLFHRECIDEWLTTGRNSCPLCRAQGVEEMKKSESTEPVTPPPARADTPVPASEF